MMSLRRLLAICSIILPFVPCFAGEEAVEVYASDRRSTLRRTGTIEDYSGEGLVILLASSRKETIPLEKIAAIESPPTPAESQAETLLQAKKPAESANVLREAIRKEPRRWVARRMAIRLADCYDLAGKPDAAADAFLAVVREDPQTPYFAAIPLAWKSSADDAAIAAYAKAKLAGTNDQIGMLIGASRLLAGPERARAVSTLELLEKHNDPRIARLASAQLWRTSISTATESDLAARYRFIENMPPELRGGPRFTAAETSFRLGRTEEALEGALQTALLHKDRSTLCLISLDLAGKILEKHARPEEAARVYREAIERYPGASLAGELDSRLRAIQSSIGAKPPR